MPITTVTILTTIIPTVTFLTVIAITGRFGGCKECFLPTPWLPWGRVTRSIQGEAIITNVVTPRYPHTQDYRRQVATKCIIFSHIILFYCVHQPCDYPLLLLLRAKETEFKWLSNDGSTDNGGDTCTTVDPWTTRGWGVPTPTPCGWKSAYNLTHQKLHL